MAKVNRIDDEDRGEMAPVSRPRQRKATDIGNKSLEEVSEILADKRSAKVVTRGFALSTHKKSFLVAELEQYARRHRLRTSKGLATITEIEKGVLYGAAVSWSGRRNGPAKIGMGTTPKAALLDALPGSHNEKVWGKKDEMRSEKGMQAKTKLVDGIDARDDEDIGIRQAAAQFERPERARREVGKVQAAVFRSTL